ncbi:MAG: cell division protein FtsL [Pseudomonadota bacterium]
MSGRLLAGWLAALAFLVCSGVQVAFSTEAVRGQHRTLQALQGRLDAAVAVYSRLQLELATVAAYQQVEQTAEQELGMRFPEDVTRVAR